MHPWMLTLKIQVQLYRGTAYKTLLLVVYKTSLFLGRSEVADYKTSILNQFEKYPVLEPISGFH